MPTFVKQPGVPLFDVKQNAPDGSTKVTLISNRYFYDRAKLDDGSDQLWNVPVCLQGAAGKDASQCELLSKREQTFNFPGCSCWVLANAGAKGVLSLRLSTRSRAALSRDAESELTPSERIMLQTDIWASVRAGREPIGDYLTFGRGHATGAQFAR